MSAPSEKQSQNIDSQTVQIVQFEQPTKDKHFQFADLTPSLLAAIIGLFTIWAVHRLTEKRERAKAVFELHRNISDAAKDIYKTAEEGWTTTSASKRKAAVASTLWQLQRIGGTVEMLRRLSKRRHNLFWFCAIDSDGRIMSQLRDAITLGDFESNSRNAKPSEVKNVHIAIIEFIEAIDVDLYTWMGD